MGKESQTEISGGRLSSDISSPTSTFSSTPNTYINEAGSHATTNPSKTLATTPMKASPLPPKLPALTMPMTLFMITLSTLGLVYGYYMSSSSPNNNNKDNKASNSIKPRSKSKSSNKNENEVKLTSKLEFNSSTSILQKLKYILSWKKTTAINAKDNEQVDLNMERITEQISNDHIETTRDSFGNYSHQILGPYDAESKEEDLILFKTPTGAPLPNILHRVLTKKELEDKNIKRFIIVGDIHGCLEELQELLLKCDYTVDRDAVILVGDLVNKGPFSAEVVQFARESEFYVIRGNHEDNALSAYYRQGKYEEICPSSYTEYLTKLSPEDISWMRNLPYTISIPYLGIIFVHAGIIPGQNIASINPILLSRMRNVVAFEGEKQLENEDIDERASMGENNISQIRYEGYIKEVPDSYPWVSKYKGPSHVYFGHDARRGLQKTEFATGLDTGCCYGKKLTSIILAANKDDLIDASTILIEEDMKEGEINATSEQTVENEKENSSCKEKERTVDPGFEDNDGIIDFKGGLWRKVVSIPSKRIYKDFDAPKEKKDKKVKAKDIEFCIKKKKTIQE